MYIVGIDIAKRFHEAAIIDRNGKVVVKRIRFANSHSGFLKLMDEVRKLDATAEFGMEATGHYWLPLYCHLRQAGQNVHVINPLQSDALRAMFIRQTKNDTIDALIVAEVIRFGRYVAAFKDPAISAFYQKKRAEGKDHLTAIGHVSHKILAIIFAVLRDNKPYFPASTA